MTSAQRKGPAFGSLLCCPLAITVPPLFLLR